MNNYLETTKTVNRIPSNGYFNLTGDTAEQVTLAAKALKADLIVTAIHHPSSLTRVLGLDQAPRILDQANCPVLVFHQCNELAPAKIGRK